TFKTYSGLIMPKLTIEDLIKNDLLNDKRVLIRVDFNVPLDDNGNITDDNRISESLPTIKAVIENGGKCILMSHLGRPKGKVNPKYSLKITAERLSELLDKEVLFTDDCIGEGNDIIIDGMEKGSILLLENLRFYEEEEKNDPDFARKLAEYGDIFINDAFGTAHRAHASTEGVTHFMEKSAAGYLMEKEIKYLSDAVDDPKRPLCAILGGSKISGKIDVIQALLKKADHILVGGGMMFTFYKALGFNIGKSILEEDKVDLALKLMEEAKSLDKEILLPVDVVFADKFENDAEHKTVRFDGLSSEYNDWIGMDIGAETIKLFKEKIMSSNTIIWNGPMGVFEMSNFAKGTFEIAKALTEATQKGAITIVGGGD